MLSSTFVDEMGYLPLRATIFFQLVSARYERGSIILTSNKSYGDWGSIFGDPIIATAILDRLLHQQTSAAGILQPVALAANVNVGSSPE